MEDRTGGGSGASGANPRQRKGLSRKQFLASAAGAGATIGIGGQAAFAQPQAPAAAHAVGAGTVAVGRRGGDITLVNGKIHTMDDANRIVSQALIRNGRFAAVGDGIAAQGGDVRVVNLKGHTVVPGMIEGHVHFVSLANRPGYHVVIENAASIAEIQALLAARRQDVPEDEFITAMGGWHPNMFAERRLPTLAELDEAVPDRPVLLYQQFNGPARTNSRGKAFLESSANPVTVGADGSIASGLQSTTALFNLRRRQTFEDRKRSTVDAMAYSASVGMTAVLDQVGFPSPGPLTPTQSLSQFDHFRMYDAWLAVHREGRTSIRLQANFLHNQNDIALPELKERLKNQFQLFGDDMMMTGGIGEWGAPGDGSGAAWHEAQRVIAEAGWRNTNRALNLTQLENIVAGYEAVNAQFDITGLRWTIHHVPVVTGALLDRLEALGGGVQGGTFSYVSGRGPAAGSPFRTIVDHGIPAGIHVDGVHIAPLNPWFGVYYAATGVNSLGEQINGGQQITRQEAVRLFTRANSWHLNMEDQLGTIEVGKLADLAVLDRDYLTVTDEQLKRIRPLMTLVSGLVVHDTGELERRHG